MSAQQNSLAAELDDLEDKLDATQALLAYIETARSEYFPSQVVDRLMDGVPPVLVYRQYRGMELEELAERIGLGEQDLADWERGVREPGLAVASRAARVLSVTVDDLVPWSRE
jgi:DNA-binding XRE family transcriptional regulator